MVTTRKQSGVAGAGDNRETRPSRLRSSSVLDSMKVIKRNNDGSQPMDNITLPAKSDLPAKTVVQKRRKALARAPKLGNHMLYLFVGPNVEICTFHTDLLPQATANVIYEKNIGQPFFRLPEEDPEIFGIYRAWLYTSRLFCVGQADRDGPDTNAHDAYGDAEWTRLAHCYLLGVTLKDEKFANTCVSAFIEKMAIADRYPTGIASEVYHSTSKGDKLRKLIVDVHVWKGHGTWVHQPHDDAEGPKEFFTDVIGGLATVGAKIHEEGVLTPWEARACDYHSHTVTAKCKA